ncbi:MULTISPECIES: AAA family ATPase [Nitrincola]|uniref:Putative ATPase n=1 Tax=Nitrincola nitratireducens TaxID=1229521 RepID=W9UST2_9GAMM|nr:MULTISPECIES: ATP-binding protein [Nitrincola]EXJ10283.1 putative ATPase [Nitrincola nitratireducens]
MLKKITISNFYSFAETTVIDFALGKKPTPSGYDLHLNGERFNKAVAIIGANGSGKTQLLKPLAFLSWFITDSFLGTAPDDDIPYASHRLLEDKPTLLVLEFRLNDKDYRYQLELNQGEVQFEAIFEKTSNQFSYLIKREKNADGYSVKQKGFGFAKPQAEKIRSNASIISAAHNFDVIEAKEFVDYFQHIETNVASSGRRHFQHGALIRAAERFAKTPELIEPMIEAMCLFDLGLSRVEIKQLVSRDETGKEGTIHVPFGLHQTSSGESFELPFFEESSGTQSAFVLLEPILKTLQQGGVAVIDELDNDLHPHLVPILLDWFRLEHTNPKQAQLIFTCHTPEVLNLLQKHQIYLVEKVGQFSEAWRADEIIGLRADDNLYAKYMAGALGAVPDL